MNVCRSGLSRLAAPLLVGALAWAGADPASGVEGKVVRATLSIYSGRPNPRWDLTPDQGAELLKRLKALPMVDVDKVPKEEGLGYHGVRVAMADGTALNGFDTLTVKGGYVRGHRVVGPEAFLDRGRELEDWLIRTAKGKIDDDLYRKLTEKPKAP